MRLSVGDRRDPPRSARANDPVAGGDPGHRRAAGDPPATESDGTGCIDGRHASLSLAAAVHRRRRQPARQESRHGQGTTGPLRQEAVEHREPAGRTRISGPSAAHAGDSGPAPAVLGRPVRPPADPGPLHPAPTRVPAGKAEAPHRKAAKNPPIASPIVRNPGVRPGNPSRPANAERAAHITDRRRHYGGSAAHSKHTAHSKHSSSGPARADRRSPADRPHRSPADRSDRSPAGRSHRRPDTRSHHREPATRALHRSPAGRSHPYPAA